MPKPRRDRHEGRVWAFLFMIDQRMHHVEIPQPPGRSVTASCKMHYSECIMPPNDDAVQRFLLHHGAPPPAAPTRTLFASTLFLLSIIRNRKSRCKQMSRKPLCSCYSLLQLLPLSFACLYSAGYSCLLQLPRSSP